MSSWFASGMHESSYFFFSLYSTNALLRYALSGALVCSSLSVLASTARITTQRGLGGTWITARKGQGFQPGHITYTLANTAQLQ